MILRDVPYGTYAARLTMGMGLFETPVQTVDVHGEAELSFSIADMGCIEAIIDFGPFDTGKAALSAHVEASGGPIGSGKSFWIEEPPYVLSGLPPGRYDLRVRPFMTDEHLHADGVEVRAGSRTAVWFTWPQ